MKFVLDGLSSSGVRVGRILCSDGSVMRSPCCLVYTRSGALPHTTLDLAARLSLLPPAVHLSFSSLSFKPGSDLLAMSGGKCLLGLETFSGVYCSVQDATSSPDPNYNGSKFVSVWTAGQRLKTNVADYMAFQEAIQPNWYESLCDTVGTADQVGLKRAQKSVERSLKFLDECIAAHNRSEVLKEASLLGVVEGGSFLELRLRSAKETAKRPVSGFVLEGFQLTDKNQEGLMSLIAKTADELPKEKVRLLHGPLSPHQVLAVMACGIDVFDSSYPYLLSTLGVALNFQSMTYKRESHSQPAAATVVCATSTESTECDRNAKPPQAAALLGAAVPTGKVNVGDYQDGDVSRSPEEVLRRPLVSYEVDLNSDRFVDDFSALSMGCTCPSCTERHTCAYIHHLLATHELLAPVLLMLHNLHQYYHFFEQVQTLLQKGVSLQQIRERFGFHQMTARH